MGKGVRLSILGAGMVGDGKVEQGPAGFLRVYVLGSLDIGQVFVVIPNEKWKK